MLTKIINVSKLEDQDLDYWVAKGLGLNVLGKALAYYDPESGYPSIDSDQKVRLTGCLQTHERYFHLRECSCDIGAQIYEEMKIEIPDLEPATRVLGHDWHCLYPVVSYSTTDDYIAQIMNEGNIMVAPVNGENEMTWVAKNVPKSPEEPIYEVSGDTIAQAVMRAFVSVKFGSMIHDPITQ